MSKPSGLSFSELLKEIIFYAQTQVENISNKMPEFFKRAFFGIPLLVIFLLFSIALLGQLKCWGQHFPFVDQQYYLYGGGQILKGKIPYIDFWDCKPVGLFLLFSGIAFFKPYQFYALPLISSLFVFIGALGIYKIARLFAVSLIAFAVSFSFVLINVSSRTIEDGQAEQFFVPLVIWAIALLFLQWRRLQHSLKALFWTGCASMLLFGVAVEIKPSCVFEGILTGVFLLSFILLNKALSLKIRFFYGALFGLVWVFLALLPTLLIITWYAQHHYLNDWIFANIQSNSKRMKWLGTGWAEAAYRHHLVQCGMFFLVLVGSSFFLLRWKIAQGATSSDLSRYCFVIFWLGITLASSTILRAGADSTHYLLPLIPPFLLFLAILWRETIILKLCLSILFLVSFCLLIGYIFSSFSANIRMSKYRDIMTSLKQQPGCLYELSQGDLFYGETEATANCFPTKYLFPDSLFNPQYRFALPVNPEVELRHILREKPLYLMLPNDPDLEKCNSRSTWCTEPDDYIIWERNSLPEREWKLMEETLKDYTPLYVEENSWGLYKLKPGLTPHITPQGVEATPSLPVIFPQENKRVNKQLQALKEEVQRWSSQ